MFHSLCYLVATLVDTRSLWCQGWVYTHVMHDIEELVATKEIKKKWDSKKWRVSRKSSRGSFWVTRAEDFSTLETSEVLKIKFNSLTPNDSYRVRTAPLTSKRCILYIYSTNIGTEYFKHGIYSPFHSLQNAIYFVILTYLVPVLFTFYIQCVLK